MKPEILFSLKLWISSYLVSNRLGLSLSKDMIIYFYELGGSSSEKYRKNLKLEYEGINREEFRSRFNIYELTDSLNHKNRVLLSNFRGLKIQNTVYEKVEVVQIKCGSILYEDYIYKTNWLRDTDVKVFDFSEEDLEGIFEKIIITAKEILKLEALNAIKNELAFSDIYNPISKVVLEKVADAYWIELKNHESLTVEQFIEIALNKYIFRIYKDTSDPKEKERKIKKVAREKFRRMSKKLGK
ncbi:MAG: hypothetical protein ROO71_15285 [Balneola sp.]